MSDCQSKTDDGAARSIAEAQHPRSRNLEAMDANKKGRHSVGESSTPRRPKRTRSQLKSTRRVFSHDNASDNEDMDDEESDQGWVAATSRKHVDNLSKNISNDDLSGSFGLDFNQGPSDDEISSYGAGDESSIGIGSQTRSKMGKMKQAPEVAYNFDSFVDEDIEELRSNNSDDTESLSSYIEKCNRKNKKIMEVPEEKNEDCIESLSDDAQAKQASVPQTQHILPRIFRFEDDVPKEVEKTEHEKEMDGLFDQFNYLYESDELSTFNRPEVDQVKAKPRAEETQHDRCARGAHELFLKDDEGYICIYCLHVAVGPKDVMPEWVDCACWR